MKNKKYLGIILGGVYGLIFRMFCERGELGVFDLNVFSISFIWVLPITIGLMPFLIAREELENSSYKMVLYPIYSVLMFFFMAFVSLLEDLVCILILLFPFIFIAGLTGFIVGKIQNKNKSKKLLSIIILPFLFAPIEAKFSNQKSSYTVETAVIINAPKSEIWKSIIEVPEIKKEEYDYGFFNYIGIPRPIRPQLEEIKLDKSQLRNLPTDKHILQSNYFVFEDISYQLIKLDNETTELKLKCNYSMNSKMNWYANFWAKEIIRDFEVKLLRVLKKKIELHKPLN